jgi:hypothetical protein
MAINFTSEIEQGGGGGDRHLVFRKNAGTF